MVSATPMVAEIACQTDDVVVFRPDEVPVSVLSSSQQSSVQSEVGDDASGNR